MENLISLKELNKKRWHRLINIVFIISYVLFFLFLLSIKGWTFNGVCLSLIIFIIFFVVSNLLYYEGVIYILYAKAGSGSMLRIFIKFVPVLYMKCRTHIKKILLLLLLLGVIFLLYFILISLNEDETHSTSSYIQGSNFVSKERLKRILDDADASGVDKRGIVKRMIDRGMEIEGFDESMKRGCKSEFKNSMYYMDDTFTNILYYDKKFKQCVVFYWGDSYITLDGDKKYYNSDGLEELMESIYEF